MSVWDDIADTPREAAKLRLRSELMTAIEKHVAGWTRTAAAQALELRWRWPTITHIGRRWA